MLRLGWFILLTIEHGVKEERIYLRRSLPLQHFQNLSKKHFTQRAYSDSSFVSAKVLGSALMADTCFGCHKA